MRMDSDTFKEVIETIKKKLGLNLESAMYISEWNGDTVSGFYDELEIDMDELNREIDQFCAEWVARKEKQ